MASQVILEICVESVEHAISAERGGAQRIELCSDLSSGGITPSPGLMQTARRHVRVPIHILIRPRAGDFVYSDREVEVMRDDIQAAKQAGMDGLVLGILRENRRIDVERTKMLVEFARPLPVTFHRAFDLARNPVAALEEVIETGALRILTSGNEKRATDALAILARLVRAAEDRILIMPCGGINSSNIVRIVRATSVREVHTSLGTSHPRSAHNGAGRSRGLGSCSPRESAAFEKRVVGLVRRLRGAVQGKPQREYSASR